MWKSSRCWALWETVPGGTNGLEIQNTEHSLLQAHDCHPGFHWKLGSLNCQIWNRNLPSWFSRAMYTVCTVQDQMPFWRSIHTSFLLLSLFASYPKYRHIVLLVFPPRVITCSNYELSPGFLFKDHFLMLETGQLNLRSASVLTTSLCLHPLS